MSKIEINNVYKIFVNNPKSIVPMVKDEPTKDILEKTGHTVGLDNVSLKIEEGNICLYGSFRFRKIYSYKTFE